MPPIQTNATTQETPTRMRSTLDRIDFSVVIPTRNRPDDLRNCIESIGEQTRSPTEVIVVNDGTLTDQAISRLQHLLNGIELTITSSTVERIPGTGTARNTGMKAARASVVVFLDDDTILAPSYLERLYRLYERYDTPTLAGIGGLLHGPAETAHSSALEVVFDAIFYQGTDPWRVNATGFSNQSYLSGSTLQYPRRADWLAGSNMSFKREIASAYRFPQWEPGREPGEDLVFGWQLKRNGYHCLIDPTLPLEHKGGSLERDEIDVQTWTRLGRNRVRAFRALGKNRHLPFFVWAMCGAGLREFVAPIFTGKWQLHLERGRGFLEGAVREVLTPVRKSGSRGLWRR